MYKLIKENPPNLMAQRKKKNPLRGLVHLPVFLLQVYQIGLAIALTPPSCVAPGAGLSSLSLTCLLRKDVSSSAGCREHPVS